MAVAVAVAGFSKGRKVDMQYKRSFLSSLLLAACHAATSPRDAPKADIAANVTVLFSAAVAGALEPCGCSPDQRGGVYRAAALIDRVRAEVPGALYLEGGDLLFESAKIPDVKRDQAKWKAETLAATAKLERLTALSIGERDRAEGDDFLSKQLLPIAATTNLYDAGGVRVGVATGAEASTLAAQNKALRDGHARLTLLVAHASVSRAQALASAAAAAGFDAILAGHADDPQEQQNVAIAQTAIPVFAVEGRGQSLLRLDFVLPPSGSPGAILLGGEAARAEMLKALDVRIAAEREKLPSAKEPLRSLVAAKIADLEKRRAMAASAKEEVPVDRVTVRATFTRLEKGLPESAAAHALIDAYNNKVTMYNIEAAKALPAKCQVEEKSATTYVGAQSCRECHADAYAFWKTTPHANAYAKLEKVNKQFSLDCVGCHVVGWQRASGPCRIDKPKALGLADVQCESCHGAGSLHVVDPPDHLEDVDVPQSRCMQCHEAENSPHFNFATYRPRIIGPGHGQPMVAPKP